MAKKKPAEGFEIVVGAGVPDPVRSLDLRTTGQRISVKAVQADTRYRHQRHRLENDTSTVDPATVG